MILLTLAVTLIVMLPQLLVPWMLIDDGVSLQISYEFLDRLYKLSDLSWLFKFEGYNGLLRTAYWSFQTINTLIFGTNAFLHHLGHIAVYVVISLLIYHLTTLIFKKKIIAFFSVITSLLFYPAAENQYRLGPVEPLLTITLLATIYLYFLALKTRRTKFVWISLVFPIIALFTKSTAVVLLPTALAALILTMLFLPLKSKYLSISLIFFIGNLVPLLINRTIFYILNLQGGYSEQYLINDQLFTRFLGLLKLVWSSHYFLIFLPPLFWGIRFLKNLRKNFELKLLFNTLILTISLCLLLIQSPWIYVFGRYLTPFIAFYSILVAEAAYTIYTHIPTTNSLKYLRAVFIALVTAIFVFNCYKIIQMYLRVLPGEASNYNAVKFISSLPKDANVFYNLGDIEYFFEIPLHQQYLYKRQDIKNSLLYLQPTATLPAGSYLVTWSRAARYKDNLISLSPSPQVIFTDNQWTVAEVAKPTTITLNQVVLGKPIATYSYQQGQKPVVIPNAILNNKQILIKLELDLDSNSQVFPLKQESGAPVITVDNNKVTYSLNNPWTKVTETLSTALPENTKTHSIMISWGPQGMWLASGGQLKFNPFTQPANYDGNLILDSLTAPTGNINSLQIFNPTSI